MNCELDVDSTCSILEQVDWGNIRQTNRSEIRNGERTPTHGSERKQQLTPEEWNELNRKLREDK